MAVIEVDGERPTDPMLGVPPLEDEFETAQLVETGDLELLILVPEEQGKQGKVILKLVQGHLLLGRKHLQLLIQVTTVHIGSVLEFLSANIVVLESDDRGGVLLAVAMDCPLGVHSLDEM